MGIPDERRQFFLLDEVFVRDLDCPVKKDNIRCDFVVHVPFRICSHGQNVRIRTTTEIRAFMFLLLLVTEQYH